MLEVDSSAKQLQPVIKGQSQCISPPESPLSKARTGGSGATSDDSLTKVRHESATPSPNRKATNATIDAMIGSGNQENRNRHQAIEEKKFTSLLEQRKGAAVINVER